MRALANSLWRVLPAVRRSERGRFLFFASLVALLSLAQVAGLAGSEALFLATLGPSRLPAAFVLASIATVGGCLLYALVVGRARNDRLFAVMLLAGALVLVAFQVGLRHAPRMGLVGLFCTYYLAQAVFVQLHFWTFAGDFFDTPTSKRLFPLFAMGSSLGGVAGGALSLALSRTAGTESLIVAWAGALLAAAALLRLGRPHLRRWGPLALEEADESSVEGVGGALRFLRRSPLALSLSVSVVGMVFSLFLLQYLYLDIFSASFATAEALAGFFGLYLAATNVLEIAVTRGLSPWLIRRFGVAQANLVHPVLTLVAFLTLALDPRLYAAVLARGSREMMEQSLAAPIRALSYNALPFRFRGRVRALLEGTLFFAAMSVAGLVLLLAGEGAEWITLCGLGLFSAALYVGANLRVRREYLRSLVEGLRSGRLDLESAALELGPRDLAQLAEQWEASVQEETGRSPAVLLQLVPLFATGGICKPLRRAARTAPPAIRAACLEALAEVRDPAAEHCAASAIDEPLAPVRLAAVRAAGRLLPRSLTLRALLRVRLEDEVAAVRAEAARQLGPEGASTLREMLGSADPEAAVAALERLPDALAHEATPLLDDPRPAVRAAALTCAARAERDALAVRSIRELAHSDAQVRRAAARALAGVRHEGVTAALAGALDDPERSVRTEAATALAAFGEEALDVIEPVLGKQRRWTVDAALGAAAGIGGARSRAMLAQHFGARVREAWTHLACLAVLPEDDGLPARFLRAALGNAAVRSHWLALRTLELLEDAALVRSVRKALRGGSTRARGDAMEVLTHLGDREPAQHFALLHESGALADKVPAVARWTALPRDAGAALRTAARSPDRWLRLATAHANDPHPTETQTMEGLLALRNVSLFAHLSLDQLDAVRRCTRESHYLSGEVVVREGEPGDELFVLLEGEVVACKHHGTPRERVINTMPAGSYFGEMAIFDGAPRTATIVVSKDARLLALDGERLHELIQQAPEMAFDIFRVLIGRLRAAEIRTSEAQAPAPG
jgi:HEAT repeat protein